MMQDRRIVMLVIGVVLFIAMSGGCAQYQLVRPHSDPTIHTGRETIHSLFWGTMYSPQVIAADCGIGIDNVVVHRNLGYDLLSVITLGFWSPIEIEYTCVSPPPPATVVIPEADDDEDE